MGGLAHFIERAGVATTSISLIREHTQALNPPRALWVPFPLGRPLGVADDPAFQRRVLRATLGLLDTATEPLIADYEEEAPAGPDPENWVCPVNLPAPDSDALIPRFLAELSRIQSWAKETRRARGRTLLGASGGGVEDIDAMASILGAIAEGAPMNEIPSSTAHVDWAHPMPLLLRHIADDLRIVYHEAVAAQPGEAPPDHRALTVWLFSQTVFGEVLTAVGEAITAVGDRRLLTLRGYLIPEGFFAGDESFGRRQAQDPPGFLRAVAANEFLRGEVDADD